jgi:AAA+ ATPase superfamily predicted ATPase
MGSGRLGGCKSRPSGCTAGGILLEDAELILRELPDAPGFGRVLAAIGRGRTQYGDIATEAGQRIEYPLSFLAESGLITRETPLGAPRRSRPRYAITDPYFRFWFHLLHNDRARIEGGMGRAVLRSRAGEWARHVGWVFEEEARNHARRLVARGLVDESTLIGRWWSAGRSAAEVNVLGLRDGRVALVGEAKWSAGPFDMRWLRDLDRKLEVVPYPAGSPARMIWTRAEPPVGLQDEVEIFGPEDMVR